jgi:hypothetical protein
MATIWNEHGGEPVNDGERKVLRLLEEGLPNDHLLIPAIQIPVRKRCDEIDVINRPKADRGSPLQIVSINDLADFPDDDPDRY